MKAHNDWKKLIGNEINKSYYNNLISFLKDEEEKQKIIFPKKEDVFNA